jgi:hypothetical protein
MKEYDPFKMKDIEPFKDVLINIKAIDNVTPILESIVKNQLIEEAMQFWLRGRRKDAIQKLQQALDVKGKCKITNKQINECIQELKEEIDAITPTNKQ